MPNDRLQAAKQEILSACGYGDSTQFPAYYSRFPLQLLGYLRLSRMQNSAELAMVQPCLALWLSQVGAHDTA